MTKVKIDTKDPVTSRLPFEPFEQYNNFCVGELESIEISESKIDEDSKWEFKGLTVPRIAFHFVQMKLKATEPDRFFTHSELPIAKVKVDGTFVTDENIQKMYTEMWRRLKHIHDQYRISPNYKPFPDDFELEFNVDGTPEERVKEFVDFFKNIKNAFEQGKNKKPIYLDAEGKRIPMTMKLIASGNRKSYLAFPVFVGRGFIEPFKVEAGKLKTVLRFGPSETTSLGSAPPAQPAASGAQMPELSPEMKRALGLE